MIIGLQDGDFTDRITSFNLELMKISAYHKKRGDIVKSCSSFIPQMYSHYYFYKDDFGSIPGEVFTNPKISYGGRFFSQIKYTPLKPEIEEMFPDVSIYEILINKTLKKKARIQAHGLLNVHHARLSLNEKEIWDKFEKQISDQKKRSIILYDYSLEKIKDATDVIKKITEERLIKGGVIRTKYPFTFSEYCNIQKWKDINFAKKNKINCSFYFTDEEIYEFCNKRKEYPFFRQIQYCLPDFPQYNENDFLKNHVQKIFKQAIFYRQKGVFFPLKYRYEKISDNVQDLLELIYLATNINKTTTGTCTVYEYAKTLFEKPFGSGNMIRITKPRAREIFYMVRENNPELFDLFYSCRRVEFKGGEFIVEK